MELGKEHKIVIMDFHWLKMGVVTPALYLKDGVVYKVFNINQYAAFSLFAITTLYRQENNVTMGHFHIKMGVMIHVMLFQVILA